jgi:hypothetical protein
VEPTSTSLILDEQEPRNSISSLILIGHILDIATADIFNDKGVIASGQDGHGDCGRSVHSSFAFKTSLRETSPFVWKNRLAQ